MISYPEDYSVELIVPFTDLNGVAITPISISAILYDGEDNELIDFGALPFVLIQGQKAILIPAIFNSVNYGEIRAARVLRVALTTASGVVRRSHSYLIESEQSLQLMVNSFQSYEAAEVQALALVNISGWKMATETRRKVALSEAYFRLTQLPMKFTPRDDLGVEIASQERQIPRDVWSGITPLDFSWFPTHFKRALRRAQMVEANELLQGDKASRLRRAGVISEKIGESAVTLRPASSTSAQSVSDLTLQSLVGYLMFKTRIERA